MIERLARHLASSYLPNTSRDRRPLAVDREQTSAITTFYNIDNDVLFLQKYANNLTPEERNYYIKENLLGLFSEFAGKIPYRKIAYLLGDRGLCYGDIRMTDMLRYTTDLAGEREVQENIGHSWVYKEFEESYRAGQLLKHAAVISPPKNWDYGYIFYYEAEYDAALARNVVKMHAIKYDESRQGITNSQNILLRINPRLIYRNTREFLEFPIFDLARTPDLDSVLKAAGISEPDVKYSRWFEDAVMKDEIILYGMSRYILLATDLANSLNQFSQEDRYKKLAEMDFLLRGMYNRAKEIKDRYDKTSVGQDYRYSQPYTYNLSYQDGHPAAFQRNFANYAAKPATVKGGGSCPSISNRGSSGFMSSYQLSEGLSLGETAESLISGSSSNRENNQGGCSNCGRESDGHYHCPHCNMAYIDETDIPADQRTKICDGTLPNGQLCGFKFNC